MTLPRHFSAHPLAAVAALALTLGACAEQAQANTTEQRAEMRLSATGTAIAAPDMATVSAGVVAEGKTAKEAMASQRENMARAVETLKQAGIPEKDIQTTSLNLSPVYSQQRVRNADGTSEAPRIVGYRASNQVNAIARDLSLVGPMLDALVDAGVNNINGINFGISTREELMNEARTKAMQELRARGQLYAQAGGFRLGPLVELNENFNQPYAAPMMMRAEMAMDSGGPTPVQGGEMSVSVTLNGVYVIGN
jgi:hypothetical protein